MATATSFPADTTPALIEFFQLESWLASSGALQLPLHQIESQQQAKGREVQRLLLQAHLQHRVNGDIGPALREYRLPHRLRRELLQRPLRSGGGTAGCARDSGDGRDLS